MQMTHCETPISGYWPMVDLRNVKVPLKAHWFCGPALRGGSLLCGQIRPPVASFGLQWPEGTNKSPTRFQIPDLEHLSRT